MSVWPIIRCPYTRSLTFLVNARGNSNSIRYAINAAILTYVLPLPENDNEEAAWVDRFLLVMGQLDGGQRTTLLSLTHLGVA